MSTPIVAYQLSLLGDAPKPGRAWRRGFWQMYWSGIGLPLPEGAERQALMLTCESHSFQPSSTQDEATTALRGTP